MQQARRGAAHADLNGPRDLGCGNAVQRGLVEVHFHVVLGFWVLDVPVNVHDAGGLLEYLLNATRQFDATLLVGAVDLGHKGVQHRRPRRNLGQLDAGAILLRNAVQCGADAPCDVMTLRFAVVPRKQVDLDVGLVRLPSHEVMPHQTIEVVGSGGAGVNLVIQHFRD